jgi:hypothetical protein
VAESAATRAATDGRERRQNAKRPGKGVAGRRGAEGDEEAPESQSAHTPGGPPRRCSGQRRIEIRDHPDRGGERLGSQPDDTPPSNQ